MLQIFPLTKEAAGTYECHVSNALGEASATGTIHVVDSIDDIPSKKGEMPGFNYLYNYNYNIKLKVLHYIYQLNQATRKYKNPHFP